MNDLSLNWRPNFGTVYTWYAMDKFGRISQMVNNGWGDIPHSVLAINNVEFLLNSLTEYFWGESRTFHSTTEDKQGEFMIDLYDYWLTGRHTLNRQHLREKLIYNYGLHDETTKPSQDIHVVTHKGLFIYHAVEGTTEGEDYPVGYEKPTKMGDYFRYLVPTAYCSIEDIPFELRGVIAVSTTIDFTVDRLLENSNINIFFKNPQ